MLIYFNIWLLNVKRRLKCYGKSNVNKTNENSTRTAQIGVSIPPRRYARPLLSISLLAVLSNNLVEDNVEIDSRFAANGIIVK
jgi:hypothetical protein